MTDPGEVAARFAARRRVVVAMDLGITVAVLGAFALSEAGIVSILPLQIATGLSVIVFSLHFVLWRCPACRHYLAADFTAAFCTKCGAAFRAPGSPPA